MKSTARHSSTGGFPSGFGLRASFGLRVSAFGFLLPLLLVAALSSFPLARGEEVPAVRLFDTGFSSPDPVSPEALGRAEKWTLLPPDEVGHAFKGDVVCANGRVALVLRQKGGGAEVYARHPKGWAMRTELVPVADSPALAVAGVKITENNPGCVALDVTYKAASGRSLVLGFELKLGQVFVQTQPRSGVTGLKVVAPCRFAVLPDFFADDMVVDATEWPASAAELPSENFLLHLLGDGDAMVMAIWHPAKEDVRITLQGEAKRRTITSSEIHYGKDGRIWVAVLDQPGIWHRRDIAAEEAEKILHLDWKAPYMAQWRVDWRREEQMTDSWEMLTQKPDGEYVKHGWYGQPESFGNVDWLKDNRRRWTTVLGSFLYPCWLDKQGEGYLQPLKKGVWFRGPALLYPINRLEATPLEAFTVVDLMRATLGVGPCEYILDVEGQKKTFQGRPTCASRTILDGIYSRKEQKARHDQVVKTLDEVLAFVRHIRGRIEDYVAFSHNIVAYCEAQKKGRPELEAALTAMESPVRKIDDYLARRKNGIKTPEFAAQLVEEFRASLVDYEGADALARCKKITAGLVDIGGNQDELVGECRMAVKILRQRAALAVAGDPRLAPIANEGRRRTQQMLRNPTSYEAPRH
jgi:hypothetical protein